MSSLSDAEKPYFEKLLGMSGGYVLDYTDPTYGDFFRKYKIDIHSKKYQDNGTSKAKKMRAFWGLEPDVLVGRVLSDMLDRYEVNCKLNREEIDSYALREARKIVERLLGKPKIEKTKKTKERDFFDEEFEIPYIDKLPIEREMVLIIESRLAEVKRVLEVKAYLSSVILCGSILEAVLLGAAQKNPEQFNSSKASPKGKNGKVKQFRYWTLANLIDVASEVDILKPDIKNSSLALRDFRNYIHPRQEVRDQFSPDEHTAKICFHALKAALASVAGERRRLNTAYGQSDTTQSSGDSQKKRSELAAEIMEKTHRVHRSVKSIACDVSSNEEFGKAKEQYNIDENSEHNRQGVVFSYRFGQYEELFSKYRELDIKANIYFGEEVSNIIKDLTGIIDSVAEDIGKINFFSSSGANMTQGDLGKISKAEHAIWYLSTGRIYTEEKWRDREAEERLRIFQNIPGRIDKALLKYTRNE